MVEKFKNDRRQMDPYSRLACGILIQAIEQAAGKIANVHLPKNLDYTKIKDRGQADKDGRQAHKDRIKAEACDFLQSDEARLWCEMAGDDFDFEVLQELIGDPSRLPVETLGRQSNPPSKANNRPEWAQPLATPAWFREVFR